ncbi:MAG: TonB family protein [Deltaproteobacteria bacterium]|nr:TonB family protein [Deltaproteobacteria bacterium]
MGQRGVSLRLLVWLSVSMLGHGALYLASQVIPSPSVLAQSRRTWLEIDVRVDAAGEETDEGARRAASSGSRATGSRGAPPIAIAGGGLPGQNVDGVRAGSGGDGQSIGPVVLLVERGDAITVQESPQNSPDVSQLGRIRTDDDRASIADRRATPNPGESPFLASGRGAIPERRPLADLAPGRGIAMDRPSGAEGAAGRGDGTSIGAALRGGAGGGGPAATASTGAMAVPHPGPRATGSTSQPAQQGDDVRTARGGPADSVAALGGERAVPRPGLAAGEGTRASVAAPVAWGRPSIPQASASTAASASDARVRDDVDAENLAASLVEGDVTASRQRARRRGDGVGGDGGGGPAGAGGARGAGGRSHPYGPGRGGWLSLDTSDDRYRPFHTRVKRRVQRAFRYPYARAVAMDQGLTVLAVVLDPGGGVSRVQVRRSSGFDDLDAAWVAAVRRAGPFGPPPEGHSGRITMALESSNPMVH